MIKIEFVKIKYLFKYMVEKMFAPSVLMVKNRCKGSIVWYKNIVIKL
jgi:hypothetical protein